MVLSADVAASKKNLYERVLIELVQAGFTNKVTFAAGSASLTSIKPLSSAEETIMTVVCNL